MPVQSTNPEYDAHIDEWRMMDDALEGEDAIKRRELNLPKPSGMVQAEKLDAAGNRYLYDNYRDRAQYDHWVRDSLRSMMGLVSRLIPEIALPAGLKSIEENATADGFSLRQLFMRMVRQTISHGRVPMVVNVDDAGNPYFSTYTARNAINWDTADQGGRQDLVLSVFREFRKKGGDRYSHECETVYREFFMQEGVCFTSVRNQGGEIVEDERALGTVGSGNRLVRGLPYLPVIYCGSTDSSPGVDEIPLLTMARAALKSYQLSADYFAALHQTSHPQPWVAGLDEAVELSVTGPSAAWDLGLNGKCGYLEFQGAGVEAVRKAMADQKGAALEAGAKVMDVSGTESGEARKTRQNDQHATLHSIVMTVAEAIEQGLRYAAEWKGYRPEEVTFTVKPEFITPVVDAQVLSELQKSVMAGTISAVTYWQYLTTGKLPERAYEDEAGLISDERESLGLNLDNDNGDRSAAGAGRTDAGAGDAA
ncbi:DUF4055 domain-containing protein [Pseudomonas syringae]|uniref:DUF4055 domain-containing protein n=1 Tax=Pseudomonas syringae pv. papulans TaxID=83963 RepID=A0A0Q0D1L9_PSESX|nr:DUF4055 domain-containing protein [Pseudomonas syringae]KPY33163.1 Uncharacterized protein ALO65_03193 [Pseudomonas syringae pv. papulans]KWS33181.1 hypothetical protein AL059_12210 [Pseudomonas syringae pv. papulans]MDH4604585.1 DUF4055 domain-containing protein [Pseudomonas syringae pv. papulans]MDH4623788.1 DUF4055 domain-containing protein [Pseudomonas syringae pv. papulans]RMN47880.1 hypothetical protein ALQ60_02015 [Pseudomonas syringae pv. papulans]